MLHTSFTPTHTYNPILLNRLNRTENGAPAAEKANAQVTTQDYPDFNQLFRINEPSLLTLTSFFEESKILKRLTYTWVPAGDLYVADRLILKFSLADQYTSYFSLLRGLFDFGKKEHVAVSSAATEKTFQVEVSAGQADEVVLYFQKIFSWLTKEIKFKLALKQVIRLQDEARKSQQEALALLYNSAA